MPAHARLVVVLLTALPAVAGAQVSPNQQPPMTGSPRGDDDKPKGVAEQAPATPGVLPTTPVLPPPRAQRKRFELFELDG